MTTDFLEPLSSRTVIVNPDGTPSAAFLLLDQKRVERIVAADQSQLAAIQALQTALSQVRALQSAANVAAQQAASPPPAGSTSGSDIQTVNVSASWATACTVHLTVAGASNLTASVTLQATDTSALSGGVPAGTNFNQTGGYFGYGGGYGFIYYIGYGELRIVENDGSDHVLYTGTFTVAYYATSTPTVLLSIDDPAALQAFVSARTSTGALTYKLDLRLTTGTSLTNVSAYFTPRRA